MPALTGLVPKVWRSWWSVTCSGLPARSRSPAASIVVCSPTRSRFDVAGGAFQHSEGEAHVFSITPVKAYAYERDEPGGATRYRF